MDNRLDTAVFDPYYRVGYVSKEAVVSYHDNSSFLFAAHVLEEF